MAERTGLEPATPGVTGRYSNQLNYRSVRSIAVYFGGWRGARTPDPRLVRAMLFQLSYPPASNDWGRIILSLKIVSIDFLASVSFISTMSIPTPEQK